MTPSDLLRQEASKMGVEISDSQMSQFMVYLQELSLWNQRFNLTAIEDPVEIVIKHFLDSLMGLALLKPAEGASVLDLGTGAGFPGLPWKIVRPDLELYLVDSLKKRIGFLDHMVHLLGLTCVHAIHGRGEDLAQSGEYREAMDIVTSRAVARMNVLCELCIPFLKIGGTFLAMKGPDGDQELEEASRAISLLGGQLFHVEHQKLPLLGDGRTMILINKIKATPRTYPRKAGTPAKKPL